MCGRLYVGDAEPEFGDGDYFFRAIRGCSSLESLELESVDVNMHGTCESGVARNVVGGMESLGRLEKLVLPYCHLPKAFFFGERCGMGGYGGNRITTLNLDSSEVSEESVLLLKRLPLLRDYSHRHTWWPEKCVEELENVFRGGFLGKVERVCLSNCFLSEESFWTICDLLDFLYENDFGVLRSLELCQNACVLEDEEIYRLLRSAGRVRSLVVLCLNGNEARVRDLDGFGIRQHRLQELVRGGSGDGGGDGDFVSCCCGRHGMCCVSCDVRVERNFSGRSFFSGVCG
jgi:hypothetical protein